MNEFLKIGRSHTLNSVLCLIVMLCIAGCMPKKKDATKDGEKKEPDAVPVEVVEIKRGSIERILKAATTLEAESNVPVFARTVNQVKEIRVEEGDRVEEDDVMLVMIDDIQRTTYNKARTQMLKGQQDYNRLSSLFKQNLVSEEAFQNAELDLEQNKLSMEEAERELGYTIVQAPVAGIVSQRSINVGDFVGSQRDISARLFDIVDFDSIVAVIYIPEKSLAELEVNQLARVYSPSLGGDYTTGYIKLISPIVDPATGTVKVTVGFSDVGRLRPGMYVNVELVTYVNNDAILVPKETLVYDADQVFAFRLVPGLEPPNRKVERLLVAPKLMDKMSIEPVGGIEVGDKLVAAGKTGLKDQSLVRLPGDPKPVKDENEDKKPRDPDSKTEKD